MPPDAKSSKVNLRITPALKAAAEKVAGREHRSLTSLIEKLLAEHIQTQPTLEDWHDRARARFARLMLEHKLAPENIKSGVAKKSYAIKSSDGEQIAPQGLHQRLGMIHGQLSATFNYVPFFYPFTRSGLAPYFTADSELRRGALDEILECFIFPGIADTVETVEFWRASPAGLASDIRPLFEDSEAFRQYQLEPGKWFSPLFMTRDLTVILHHAYHLAKGFPSSEAVELRCEWSGLLERELAEAHPQLRTAWSRGRIARVDHRITQGEWSIADIPNAWPEMVSALGGPVMRLFDTTFDYSPNWVREQVRYLKG